MNTHGSERGSVSVEFAIVMVVVLLGFVMLAVYGGRVVQAENEVQSAAHDAARAASLQGSPEAADAAARSVATANLTAAGIACTDGATISVDVSRFGPGGEVTVTVTCRAAFDDAVSLGVAPSEAYSASATEVIDTYRGT